MTDGHLGMIVGQQEITDGHIEMIVGHSGMTASYKGIVLGEKFNWITQNQLCSEKI